MEHEEIESYVEEEKKVKNYRSIMESRTCRMHQLRLLGNVKERNAVKQGSRKR
jgi:hypothetical protein